MDRKQQARHIQEQIPSILVSDWDPLGVAENPNLTDEYDSYIGGIYRLLYGHASIEEVAHYLHEIVIGSIGLSSDRVEDHLGVARKLCSLDVRL